MIYAHKSELIKKGGADEIVARRDRAIELLQKGLEYLAEGFKAHREAAESDRDCSAMFRDKINWHAISEGNTEAALDQIRAKVDASVWLYLQGALGLSNLMDATENAEFRKQLETNPPIVTRENLVATFSRLNSESHIIFRRGIVTVFEKLDRRYATNKAFKITPRIVLHYLMDRTGWNHYRNGRETIHDIDRIFHMLDGKGVPEHIGGAASLCGDQRNRPGRVETPYFVFKICLNGNIHVQFKRLDLLAECNRLIAAHFGAALPHERERKAA
jgi:hypothetical protein